MTITLLTIIAAGVVSACPIAAKERLNFLPGIVLRFLFNVETEQSGLPSLVQQQTFNGSEEMLDMLFLVEMVEIFSRNW